MKRSILLFLLLILLTYSLQAQHFHKENLVVNSNLFIGKILPHNPEVRSVLLNGNLDIYSLRLGYQTRPSDSSIFASDYNYPTFGVGFSLANFSHVQLLPPSRVGTIYAVYGFMERPLFRLRRFQLDYTLDAGVAYATQPYDPRINPSNCFVSSPVMMYIGFGLEVKYRLANQLEIGLDAEVKHYSNGRLGMPNNGINMAGIGVNIRYYLDPQPERFLQMPKQAFAQKWYFHAMAGIGWQTSLEEWQIYSQIQPDPALKQKKFVMRPKYSVTADAMYRLSRKYGVGAGVDLFYTPHTGKLREWDNILCDAKDINGLKYNPVSVGVSLNQEIYYRNLALSASFGYYIFRQLGVQCNTSGFYQRAGFRYYFPALKNIFIGYSIKAHNFSLAEYLEFSAGIKL